MTGSLVVLSCFVSGCASSHSEQRQERLSARFSERTTYRPPDAFVERVEGAFDWTARTGSAVTRVGRKTVATMIQIGDDCYSRFGRRPWKKTRASDPDGLCSAALFSNPATDAALVRKVADDWRKLGVARIRGVRTTHYSGTLNIGAVQGPIDVWLDEKGRERRVVDRGKRGGEFTSVRDYYDFGVRVSVRPPWTSRGQVTP